MAFILLIIAAVIAFVRWIHRVCWNIIFNDWKPLTNNGEGSTLYFTLILDTPLTIFVNLQNFPNKLLHTS